MKKRIPALLLALCMLLGMAPSAATAESKADGYIQQAGGSDSAAAILDAGEIDADRLPLEDPEEVVRVSIVLEQPSTAEAGYSAIALTNSTRAKNYRTKLRESQLDLQRLIESEILDGGQLDVVWNLTFAANIISANVRRSDIEAIKALPGVRTVEEEIHFTVDDDLPVASPNMALSGGLTGVETAWSSGYTGAGSKIAVIDTGLDWQHQSFDPDAFLYAIEKAEKEYGREYDLMDTEEINRVLSELNVADLAGVTAMSLYRNAKVPFAYNYIDENDVIDHLHDDASEHGSHVAGIAAANRYVDMDPNKDDEVHDYREAINEVHVVGNAPDAQLVIMKVFGEGGGAYESDYVAAIEDAMILGCDSINLSLGSAQAGYAKSSTYQDIFDKLARQEKSVVTISSGNSGSWPENTAVGKLYNDGVNFSTDGSPGSFTNSFTVASVDNNGFIGTTLQVDDHLFSYTDPVNCELPTFLSLDDTGSDAGKTVKFIMLGKEAAGYEEEYLTKLKEDGVLTGDFVLMLWRGVSNFTVKVKSAQDAGAMGVLVANSETGTIAMDLTGLDETVIIPAATIQMADGQAIWDSVETKNTVTGTHPAEGEEPDGEAGTEYSFTYIQGDLTIINKALIHEGEGTENPVMSYFSSWGVPGTLELKPEITAPGGSIYSVFGEKQDSDDGTDDHDDYGLMSGTSMAAPQVAGLAAQIQQYLREKHPDYKTHTARVLTQSLLMSTAKALKNGEDYYPVLQQGAGLANVGAAVKTPVYIIVSGQEDGKVKAELGDDALKKGVYTFSFTLYNMAAEPYTYQLSADMFTQAVEADPSNPSIKYLSAETRTMGADVSFSGGGSVTVGANSSATVAVTIELTAEEIAQLEKSNPKGAYVEGFIFAKPNSTAEGEALPELSIPVLGYYGNWSDPAMFDLGDCDDWINEDFERTPYMLKDGVMLGYATNAVKANGALLMNGDGVSSLAGIDYFYYSLIRNAGAMRVVITNKKTGETFFEKNYGSDYAAFYSSGDWSYEQSSVYIGWTPPATLTESDEIEVTLIAAPEYYADANGTYDWKTLTDGTLEEGNPELGEGCYLRTTLTIDNEEPEIVKAEVVEDAENNRKNIEVTFRDNVGVSRISLYSADGKTLVYEFSGDYYNEDLETTFDRSAANTEEKVVFDGKYTTNFILSIFGINVWENRKNLSNDVYRVEVEDIAGHVVSTRVFLGVEATDKVTGVTMTPSVLRMIPMRTSQITAEVKPVYAADRSVTWDSSDDSVATVDQNGVVTAVSVGTATITATSTLGGKVGKCTVTVQPVYVTVNGVMVGVDGQSQKFSWDIANDELTVKNDVESVPVGGAAIEGTDDMYLYDAAGHLYRVDGTGKKVEDVATWSSTEKIPYAIDYSETGEYPGLWAARDGDIYYYPDPHNLNSYKVISGQVASAQQPIIGIAVSNLPWETSSLNGDTTVYAVGAKGYVYTFQIYTQDGAMWFRKASSQTTDLNNYIMPQGKDDLPMCDLFATDNRLYLSVRNNDGCMFLRLPTVKSKNWDYMGKLESSVLDHVILADVQRIRYDFNGDAKFDIEDAKLLLEHVTFDLFDEVLVDNISDANVDGVGLSSGNSHDVHALLKILAGDENNYQTEDSGVLWAGNSLDYEAEINGDTIKIEVYAHNSTNARVILSWDKISKSRRRNTLQIKSFTPVESDEYLTYIYEMYSEWGGEDTASYEEPTIYFGYAGAKPINGLLFTVEFAYTTPADREKTAEIEISLMEEGEKNGTDTTLLIAPSVVGDSQISESEDAFDSSASDETKKNVTEALKNTAAEGTIFDADIADIMDDQIPADAAEAALEELGIDLIGKNINYIVENYLDVTLNSYAENAEINDKTLALDIDAYAHMIATIAESKSGVILEGEGQNAVLLPESERKLAVDEAIDLKIGVPNDFTDKDTILVQHIKNSGVPHLHKAAVTRTTDASGKVLSTTVNFRSSDGLSPFVLSTTATAEASIGELYYATLADAVAAAADGDTITLECDVKLEKDIVVNREVRFTLDRNGKSIEGGRIAAGSGYRNTGSGDNYCFESLPPVMAYAITTAAAEHGTVSVNLRSAPWRSLVNVIVTPDEGYVTDTVSVISAEGRTVEVTDNGDGTYSFTMPACAVTVTATFKPATHVCPSESFRDVDQTKWYHEYVDYVIEKGLMNGVGGGLFEPEETVSRAQMVQVLWNQAGRPQVNYLLTYTDVAEGAWYTEAIRWATSVGIVKGNGDGTFEPEEAITREQMAVMIYRYEKTLGGGFTGTWMFQMEYADLAEISDWASEAIAWCTMNKILEGKGGHRLDPQGTALRCEMAAIMMRYFELEK